MNKEQFRNIADNYIGKIIEDNDQIHIENINEICNYYVGGEVATKKKVLCKVGIRKENLFGEEATYSIIGGFCGAFADDERVKQSLQQYGFTKKTSKQLSIFDMAEGL